MDWEYGQEEGEIVVITSTYQCLGSQTMVWMHGQEEGEIVVNKTSLA